MQRNEKRGQRHMQIKQNKKRNTNKSQLMPKGNEYYVSPTVAQEVFCLISLIIMFNVYNLNVIRLQIYVHEKKHKKTLSQLICLTCEKLSVKVSCRELTRTSFGCHFIEEQLYFPTFSQLCLAISNRLSKSR